jgi:hypothetical protein
MVEFKRRRARPQSGVETSWNWGGEMALQGSVAAAAAGLIGFDFDAELTAAQAADYAGQGYRFCIRYLSRDDASRAANNAGTTPDLSEAEGAGILAAGLALMAVQHVARNWSPSAALGATYGANAARYAGEAGLPPGVNLWLDLEDVAAGSATPDITGYCNAWFDAVAAQGFVPGVYVGANARLTPDELFLDLKMRHYWRAPGDIPAVSHRGYQLIQHTLNGFDRDVTATDALGGAVIWLSPT